MIQARAVVDVEHPPSVFGLGRFRVEVWGVEEPYDYVRIYVIQHKSDNHAAREALDRFVAEMEALGIEKDAEKGV